MLCNRKAAFVLLFGVAIAACGSSSDDSDNTGGSSGAGGSGGGHTNACTHTKCIDEFPYADEFCDEIFAGPCATLGKSFFECSLANDACLADGKPDRSKLTVCWDKQSAFTGCIAAVHSDGGTD